MNIIERTLTMLPAAMLLGFGVSIFYLVGIMYMTGCLPDISTITDHLSGPIEQIAEALGG